MGTMKETVKIGLQFAIIGVGVTLCVLVANVMVLREERLTHDSTRSKRQTIEESVGSNGGAIYIRWGRSSCPDTNTELVYRGFAGGSYQSHPGGGSNYVCLTDEPAWGTYNDANHDKALIYGAEFELFTTHQDNPNFPFTNDRTSLGDHSVPCAVCLSRERATKLMIPGTNVCTSGWTKEYQGYLVTGHYLQTAQHDFVCMDENPVPSECGVGNQNGALFYSVEAECGALPCLPYVQNREITCVVCSR